MEIINFSEDVIKYAQEIMEIARIKNVEVSFASALYCSSLGLGKKRTQSEISLATNTPILKIRVGVNKILKLSEDE